MSLQVQGRRAQTLRRSKTDSADAVVLAEYGQRMPICRWQRPAASRLALRILSLYLGSLVAEQAGLKTRLRSAESTATTPRAVRVNLQQSLGAVDRRISCAGNRRLRASLSSNRESAVGPQALLLN